MFDFVRTHRNWMMLFILVLILPSFVFSVFRATTATSIKTVRWPR